MSRTVAVACKLPGGLNLGPGPNGRPVILNGSHHASGAGAGGFGITSVDADFWANWAKDHAKFGPVANGLIFAAPARNDTLAEGVTRSELKTGLEPLDPDAPGPGLEETEESKQQRRGARLRSADAD